MNHHETIVTRPIPLGQLRLSPLNVRKTLSQAGIDEMKASIDAHGLMHNLIAYEEDGVYLVVAGGRRLAALNSLADDGKLDADYAVLCRIVTADQAVEFSLAENTIRLAMHPADEHAAYTVLIEAGESVEAIAGRSAKTTKYVEQRLKLGRAAPELIQEYREGKITLDILEAFTITDDRHKQLTVYRSLTRWQKEDAGAIRRILTEQMVEATSKLAVFVGLDAYETAGGTTRSDLFGEDVFLGNPELLNTLASKKLALAEQALTAEGWGWVEVNPDRDWDLVNRCGRIKAVAIDPPQELIDAKAKAEADLNNINQALEDTESDALTDALDKAETRLSEIEERLAGYVEFDPDQKLLAGCYVSIGSDGELSIEKGLVRPEHKKRLAASDDDQPAVTGANGKLPKTLRHDLEAYRLQAAQAEIARHPAIAFDLLVFHVACGIFDHLSPQDGPDVHFRQSHPRPTVESDTVAAEQLERHKATLPLDWLDLNSESARFTAFRRLSDDEKLHLLAYCTALTLKPSLAPTESDEPTAYDLGLCLTAGDVAAYWRPTKTNYLSRITREQLLAIGRDVLGDVWAQSRHKDKKSELADQLDRAFSNPGQPGRTPEQTEKLKRWLPDGMAFGIPAIPALTDAEEFSQAA
jgi:ParB family transcriptional regulator, chromosome partitioning protein